MAGNPIFVTIGRIFYGVSISALGFLTIYYRDFPYFLIPLKHAWISDHKIIAYLFGTFLFLAGACIVFEKKLLMISLLLGSGLLLIFFFYFIPYQLFVSPDNMHFADWENAFKELALASGALIIADYESNRNKNLLTVFWRKVLSLGAVIFPLTILSFGINHFLYAKEAAGYVPSWIPNHLFWIYFAGVALLGSSLAILLKIKVRLSAGLLGIMIFIWVVILHIPYALAAPFAENGGEITSAFLALAYSGIAFSISGNPGPWPQITLSTDKSPI